MKNGLIGFFCGVLVTSLLGIGSFTLASGLWETIDVLENNITVIADGEKVNEDNFVYQGKTYVPLRAVAEAVGKKVSYDERSNIAYVGINLNKKTEDDDTSAVISPPLDQYEEVRDLYYPNLNFYQKGNFYFLKNAVGGICLNWCATNISDKDIKNIKITVRLYDSAGNLLTDDYGKTEFQLRKEGPFYSGSSFRLKNSKPFAYSNACAEVSIDEIIITFMDGTKVSGNYGFSTTWDR